MLRREGSLIFRVMVDFINRREKYKGGGSTGGGNVNNRTKPGSTDPQKLPWPLYEQKSSLKTTSRELPLFHHKTIKISISIVLNLMEY